MKTTVSKRVSDIIKARLQAKVQRERTQQELLKKTDIHHSEIVSKLTGLWETNQMANLSRCGLEKIYRTCLCCGATEEFDYRCSLKFCPRCQWRLAKVREQKIRIWASRIKQPKHLVLTETNFPILTRSKVSGLIKNLRLFRHRKIFKEVRGGCCSIEITNVGNGWHLHSHWLLDVNWLDMPGVAKVWGKLVGQDYGIVKIKDVRGSDYVNEVCKYLAKGSDLAKWPPELLLEFVTAIYKRRFFFSFGSLLAMSGEVKRIIRDLAPAKVACECGERSFRYETEEAREIKAMMREGTPMRTKLKSQMRLAGN